MWIVPLVLVGILVYVITGNNFASAFGLKSASNHTCPSCSQSLQDDWKNCPHCGQTL